MLKFSAGFIAAVSVLLLSCAVCLAQEAAPAAPVAEPPVGGSASVLAQSALVFLQIVGPALAALIGAAVVWLIHKVGGKFKVQMSAEQDLQVMQIVERGVLAAEEWARQQGQKPTGNEKADKALGIVRDLLETDTYKEYGEEPLRKLIDAGVHRLRENW